MARARELRIPREPAGRIPLGNILLATIVAFVAATVVNVVVFLIGDAAGAFPDDFRFEAATGGGETTMGVSNVIFTTLFYFVIAGIVFAIISRLSRRPVRIFSYVTIAAGLISLFQPFSIDAPGDMIAFLLAMHMLSTVIAVVVMPWFATTGARSAVRM